MLPQYISKQRKLIHCVLAKDREAESAIELCVFLSEQLPAAVGTEYVYMFVAVKAISAAQTKSSQQYICCGNPTVAKVLTNITDRTLRSDWRALYRLRGHSIISRVTDPFSIFSKGVWARDLSSLWCW